MPLILLLLSILFRPATLATNRLLILFFVFLFVLSYHRNQQTLPIPRFRHIDPLPSHSGHAPPYRALLDLQSEFQGQEHTHVLDEGGGVLDQESLQGGLVLGMYLFLSARLFLLRRGRQPDLACFLVCCADVAHFAFWDAVDTLDDIVFAAGVEVGFYEGALGRAEDERTANACWHVW